MAIADSSMKQMIEIPAKLLTEKRAYATKSRKASKKVNQTRINDIGKITNNGVKIDVQIAKVFFSFNLIDVESHGVQKC